MTQPFFRLLVFMACLDLCLSSPSAAAGLKWSGSLALNAKHFGMLHDMQTPSNLMSSINTTNLSWHLALFFSFFPFAQINKLSALSHQAKKICSP